MNEVVPDFPSSPARVGNFVIAYQSEYDSDTLERVSTDRLLQFIAKKNNSECLLCDTDASFFPRAFTDTDLNTAGEEEQQLKVEELVSDKPCTARVIRVSGNKIDNLIHLKGSMENEGNRMLGRSFQPDVIVSNSNQRSGPDGSPALVPSQSHSHGFIPSSTLSETGELFAPVRTLTFSDIDQSSQIEDSYNNGSRLVSTPNRDDSPGHGYDYSSLMQHASSVNQNLVTENNMSHQAHVQGSSSNSDDDRSSREVTPEFRELDGEADSDLTSTGAFKPSAMGINQEFLDNFTGRTGGQGMHLGGDIFSPLGGKGYSAEGHQSLRRTPPLHSPRQNSPYANNYGYKSGRKYGNNKSSSDFSGEEMQFNMSPTRNPPAQFFYNNASSDRSVTIPKDMLQNNFATQDRQDFMNNDRFYPNEHMFEPIDKQPRDFTMKKTFPQNLSDYQDQGYSTENYESGALNFDGDNFGQGDSRSQNRQGDGVANEGIETLERHEDNEEFDHQFAAVSQLAFEQRYLQRTQVSVKLPQATYDTLAPEILHGDNPIVDISQQSRGEPTGLPPDSLEEDDDEEDQDDPVEDNSMKRSPAKIVDLLQMQVSNVKERKSPDEIEIDHSLARSENEGGADSDNGHDNSRATHDLSIKSMGRTQNTENISNNVVNTGGQRQACNETVKNVPNKTSFSSEHQNVAANQGNEQQTSLSKVAAKSKSSSQIPSARSAGVSQLSHSNQTVSETQPPSSRLLQETVSQRNKSSQKFLPNGPAGSKQVTNQQREFKKPYDVQKKANNTSCTGARGLLLNDSDKGAKSKFNDKSKSKSNSTESLSQKVKTSNSNQSKTSNANRSEQISGTQSRHASYQNNQSNRSQGRFDKGQSQDQRGQGQLRRESHNRSGHSVEDGRDEGRVITQVETTSPVPIDLPDQNIKSSKTETVGDTSLDIRGMEEVRHQLQGMLRLSHDHMSPQERSHYEHSDIIAGFGMEMGDQHLQMAQELSWNTSRKHQDGELVDNFPTFSSQFLVDSGNVSRSDVSLNAENQRLREMLEKERYRRKHCEQYIQQLNIKLLETQQQVAVAVSTDKRKDIMIDQLDKQLAKVVEGWKKRDLDKDAFIEEVKKEKEEIENNLQQQQEMIGQFERDMSQAVEALRQEKENSAQSMDAIKEKIYEAERSKVHAEELLSAEQEKVQLHQQENDNLREARENLDKKLDQMQRRLHREQDDWFQREQELLQRIEEVAEKNTKILHMERTKNEEQGKLAEEIMEQYQMANTKVKKLEMDVDAALREKESMKVEMGIMEAKFENAQRVLEADMHSHMEKQIAEQIADVQKRSEKIEDEMREKHRHQIVEMNQRHGKETEKQLAVFREEVQKKEEDFRKQLQELEARLVEYRTENSELKLTKQKLESTRLEILTKLQYAMQSQWNEALSLLSTTPQRKNPNQTAATLDESAVNQSIQSVPTVNFNLLSPCKTVANQGTPQKHSANEPSEQPSNQNSPLGGTLTNHDKVASFSPAEGSVMSHMAHNDDRNLEREDQAIENTALSHLKEFQDYMNSLTQTPEWISSINARTESSEVPQRPSPVLPSPPDLAALLSTHLQNMQYQQLGPRPFIPANQSLSSRSQPNSLLTNQKTSDSASLPVDLNLYSANLTNQSELKHNNQSADTSSKSTNQTEVLMSHAESSQSDNTNFHSDLGNSVLWEETQGLSRAVPIRPPQQRDDHYLHDDDDHSIISSINGGQMGYFQGGQSFSPPTKQNRTGHSDSMEDLTHQSFRLNEDYSHLSEKLEKHESHQNELQHYIQMLLNKSPDDGTVNNDSIFSQDNEELDLNDTAQAAQLQKELDRIQELRQKQESSSKNRETSNPRTEAAGPQTSSASGTAPSVEVPHKILNPDQMAEISKLLNEVKGQSQPQNTQVTELLALLKHAQGGKGNQLDQKRGHSHKQSPKTGAGCGDKHKGLSGSRRNVQFHPSKSVDGVKHNQEVNKHDKAIPKAAPQVKKVERKVAGSATKADKGPKPVVWK